MLRFIFKPFNHLLFFQPQLETLDEYDEEDKDREGDYKYCKDSGTSQCKSIMMVSIFKDVLMKIDPDKTCNEHFKVSQHEESQPDISTSCTTPLNLVTLRYAPAESELLNVEEKWGKYELEE